GSKHQHNVLCADEVLHVGKHARVKGAEVGGAVMGGKRRHGSLGGRKQRRRAGRKQTILKQHWVQRILMWSIRSSGRWGSGSFAVARLPFILSNESEFPARLYSCFSRSLQSNCSMVPRCKPLPAKA